VQKAGFAKIGGGFMNIAILVVSKLTLSLSP
jgi:hypothetical protein